MIALNRKTQEGSSTDGFELSSFDFVGHFLDPQAEKKSRFEVASAPCQLCLHWIFLGGADALSCDVSCSDIARAVIPDRALKTLTVHIIQYTYLQHALPFSR